MDNRLRELRLERGWQQVKLAVVVGVSPSTIGAIERYAYPASATIRLRIARALKCRVEDIWPAAPEDEPRHRSPLSRPGRKTKPPGRHSGPGLGTGYRARGETLLKST